MTALWKRRAERDARVDQELRRLADELASLSRDVLSRMERLESRQSDLDRLEKRHDDLDGKTSRKAEDLERRLGTLDSTVQRMELQAQSDAKQAALTASGLLERVEALRRDRG